MLVFALASLYFARGHLKRVLQCAIGRKEQGYDSHEPSSYRFALIMLSVSA